MLVEEATAAGRFVMAHAQATDGIKNAVRAGVRSIEHGIYLDDEAIELMLERGTWLVPTLIAPVWVLESVDAGAHDLRRVDPQGARGRRGPRRLGPAGGRRGGQGRHGHRRRCRAARGQPAGAGPHGGRRA